MRLLAATGLLATTGLLAATVTPGTRADPPVDGRQATVYQTVTETTAARAYGHSAGYWHFRDHQARRLLRQAVLRRGLLARRLAKQTRLRVRAYQPTVRYAIALARVVYGVDQSRRIRCESHGDIYARNNGSPDSPTGILQFKPSTWASTPFAGFSIYDPVAQTLAGGWMIRAGRSREWSCGL